MSTSTVTSASCSETSTQNTGSILEQYPCALENGQRKYGPPPDWSGATPGRGTEVFIGHLPRQLKNDEILLKKLCDVGRLYQLRIMLDFSGTNRGFGFAVFATRTDAQNAIAQLHESELIAGHTIGVMQSVDNRRLFIGGLPRQRTSPELKNELDKFLTGVVDVIQYPSANDKSKNRGFAFVEFQTHKDAALARQKMMKEQIKLWGAELAVDWAEPEQDVDEEIMKRVKILYVRNLLLSTTEEELTQIFERLCDNEIERVKKIKDFAFIHFRERVDAEQALRRIDEMDGGLQICNLPVEVCWSKPPENRRSIMRHVREKMKNTQGLNNGPQFYEQLVANAWTDCLHAQQSNGPVTPLPPNSAQYYTPIPPLTVKQPPPPSGLPDPNNNTTTKQALLASLYGGAPLYETSAPPTSQPVHQPIWQNTASAPLYALDTMAYRALASANAHAVHNGVALSPQAMSPPCSLASLRRNSAGTRGAGMQVFVNNHMRRQRRKYAEALLGDVSSSQTVNNEFAWWPHHQSPTTAVALQQQQPQPPQQPTTTTVLLPMSLAATTPTTHTLAYHPYFLPQQATTTQHAMAHAQPMLLVPTTTAAIIPQPQPQQQPDLITAHVAGGSIDHQSGVLPQSLQSIPMGVLVMSHSEQLEACCAISNYGTPHYEFTHDVAAGDYSCQLTIDLSPTSEVKHKFESPKYSAGSEMEAKELCAFNVILQLGRQTDAHVSNNNNPLTASSATLNPTNTSMNVDVSQPPPPSHS